MQKLEKSNILTIVILSILALTLLINGISLTGKVVEQTKTTFNIQQLMKPALNFPINTPYLRLDVCKLMKEPTRIKKLISGNFTEVRVNAKNGYIYAISKSPNVLYRSKNNGRSFDNLGQYDHFEFDKVNPNLLYTTKGNKLFVSQNKGDAFTLEGTLSGTLEVDSLYTDQFTTGLVYIGIASVTNHDSYKFWKYNLANHRLTYIDISSKFRSSEYKYFQRRTWSIAQDPQNQNILFISSEDADHTTADGGSYKNGTNQIYFANLPHTNYFIMRSLDRGQTWQPYSTGLPWHSTQIIPFLDENRATRWIADTESREAYILNLNNGQWERLFYGIYTTDYKIKSNQHYAIAYLNANNAFQMYQDSRVIKSAIINSNNNGRTWNIAFELPEIRTARAFDFDKCNDLYIADYNQGLFKYTQDN